jgi:Protein of unknown function (DUF559)
MLRLLRAAELPTPRVNARVGRFEVDFLWPAHRLIVEVDGYAYHSDRGAFERDRRRDATWPPPATSSSGSPGANSPKRPKRWSRGSRQRWPLAARRA